MANKIQLKRSSVSGKVPTTTDLDLGELALNTNDGKLYTKKSDGTTETVVQLSVDSTVVKTTDSGTVTSAMIADGTIVNGDVSASAAIAGSKISPDFGSQTVTTTGTSTAASFIPTSSTAPANGLYLPAANSVALSANGTQRLLIDASGNVNIDSNTLYVDATNNRVGIATSSPVDLLTIAGDPASLTLYSTQSTLAAETRIGKIGFYTSDISTNGTGEYAIIDACTTITYDNATTKNGETAIRFFTTDNNGAPVTAERVRIDNAGRVGIGTPSPGAPLHVNPGAGNNGSIRVDYGTGSTADGYFEMWALSDRHYLRTVKSGGGVPLAFETNSLERARIDTSGRLGVGTSAPSERLHLIGSTAAASTGVAYNALRITANSNTPGNSGGLTFGAYWHNVTVGERTAYIQSSQGLDAGGTARALLLNPSGGNVGIGDNLPDSTLTVKAASGVTPFKVSGPSSEFAKIDTSGRLLVGTSSAVAGANLQTADSFSVGGLIKREFSKELTLADNVEATYLTFTVPGGVVGNLDQINVGAEIAYMVVANTETNPKAVTTTYGKVYLGITRYYQNSTTNPISATINHTDKALVVTGATPPTITWSITTDPGTEITPKNVYANIKVDNALTGTVVQKIIGTVTYHTYLKAGNDIAVS